MKKLFLLFCFVNIFSLTAVAKSAFDYFEQASLCLQINDNICVKNSLDNAKNLAPDWGDLYSFEGYWLAYNAKWADAIAAFTTAIKYMPKDEVSYYGRGMVYATQRNFDKAFPDLTYAINLNPKDASAWGARGLAYVYLGEKAKALYDFKQAINLEPNSPINAIAYYFIGTFENNNSYIEKAKILNPALIQRLSILQY